MSKGCVCEWVYRCESVCEGCYCLTTAKRSGGVQGLSLTVCRPFMI